MPLRHYYLRIWLCLSIEQIGAVVEAVAWVARDRDDCPAVVAVEVFIVACLAHFLSQCFVNVWRGW